MVPLISKLAEDVVVPTSYCTVNGQLTTCGSTSSMPAIFSGVFLIIWLLLAVVIIASMWKLFTKAKKPGWAALIPIYNTLVLLQIIGRPWWWILLMLIPFVNIVLAFIVIFDFAKSYGKSVGYGLLMLFLPIVGYPLLAFSDAAYVGPAAGQNPVSTPPTPEPQAPTSPQPPATPTSPASTPPSNPVQ